VLGLEGAVLRGPRGTGRFHRLAGPDPPMAHWVSRLATAARQVVAIGTCAACGGIAAARDNPPEACAAGSTTTTGPAACSARTSGAPAACRWATSPLARPTLAGCSTR
jgi:Ni,Fe-hydrogenase I small subunit